MGQSWYQLDWVWATLGWTLAVIAAAMLLRALFRDRSRGRRRCPRCWYELAGVPEVSGGGYICPECGRRLAVSKQLLRTRRYWRRAFVACVLLVGAYGLVKLPNYQRGGWVRLVPTTYLSLFAATEHFTRALPTLYGMGGGFPATGPPVPLEEMLGEEAWRRVQQGEMWGWQSTLFVRRAVEPFRDEWAGAVKIPERWPEGEPMPMLIEQSKIGAHWPLWIGADAKPGTTFTRRESVYPVTTRGRAGSAFEPRIWFLAQYTPVYSPKLGRSCAMVARVEDLFEKDESAEMGAIVAGLLKPRVFINSYDVMTISMRDRGTSEEWRKAAMGMGCRIQIRIKGSTAGWSQFSPSWHEEYVNVRQPLPIAWELGMRDIAEADPDAIELVLTGDMWLSFASYREWPFDSGRPKCWMGRVVVKPEVEYARGAKRRGKKGDATQSEPMPP